MAFSLALNTSAQSSLTLCGGAGGAAARDLQRRHRDAQGARLVRDGGPRLAEATGQGGNQTRHTSRPRTNTSHHLRGVCLLPRLDSARYLRKPTSAQLVADLTWRLGWLGQVEAPWIPKLADTTDLTFFQPDGTRAQLILGLAVGLLWLRILWLRCLSSHRTALLCG